MSADAISGCPRCISLALGKTIAEITLDEYNEHLDSGPLREYFEFYIDRGHVVADYSADCRECGYQIEFVVHHPLPEE